MTKGVVFYAEPPEQSQSGDIARWTNLLEKLGFDFYIVIDNHDLISHWVETKTITGHRVETMAEAITKLDNDYSTCTKVKVHHMAPTKISSYTIPTNSVFLIGSDQNGLDVFTEDAEVKCVTSSEVWAIDCVNQIAVKLDQQGL